jgi:hypothetical protein
MFQTNGEKNNQKGCLRETYYLGVLSETVDAFMSNANLKAFKTGGDVDGQLSESQNFIGQQTKGNAR